MMSDDDTMLGAGQRSMRAVVDEIDDPTAVRSAICRRYNCAEADVDADGDVWIADQMTGHWLTGRELVALADWLRTDARDC